MNRFAERLCFIFCFVYIKRDKHVKSGGIILFFTDLALVPTLCDVPSKHSSVHKAKIKGNPHRKE